MDTRWDYQHPFSQNGRGTRKHQSPVICSPPKCTQVHGDSLENEIHSLCWQPQPCAANPAPGRAGGWVRCPPWAASGQDGSGALELLVEVSSVGREGRELGQEHTSDCDQRLGAEARLEMGLINSPAAAQGPQTFPGPSPSLSMSSELPG